MPPDLSGLLEKAIGDVKELPNVPDITRRGRILVRRRRGFRLAIAGAVATTLVVAGSSIDLFQAQPLPPVKEAPAPQPASRLVGSSALERGEYHASDFVVPFTFQIKSTGWFAGVVSPTWVYVTRRGFHLNVQRWANVVTPRGPRAIPPEVITWFTHHPGLEVLRTQATEVGGVSATLVDVRAREAFTREHSECPATRCLLLADIAEHEEMVDLGLDEAARFYVLETSGAPVFVYWRAPMKQFERAKRMMDVFVRSLDFYDAGVL